MPSKKEMDKEYFGVLYLHPMFKASYWVKYTCEIIFCTLSQHVYLIIKVISPSTMVMIR